MIPMDTIIFLAIGGMAGWIAGLLTQGTGYGLLRNIIIGVIGSVIGGWLFTFLKIELRSDLLGKIVTACAGSLILLWLARSITSPMK